MTVFFKNEIKRNIHVACILTLSLLFCEYMYYKIGTIPSEFYRAIIESNEDLLKALILKSLLQIILASISVSVASFLTRYISLVVRSGLQKQYSIVKMSNDASENM